ncbi:MAG: transcriptional regulator NrdR [Elusimicrobiota bacterium]|nr:transcriptional regulator NrdR [Elusimicrobiota bacterium]
MKCPFCANSDGRVIDSRPVEGSSVVRRRRECFACKKRFTTFERIESMPLMVIKKDKRREVFDRNKLQEGILLACQKRPISLDIVEKIVSEIEEELQDYIMEVPSKVIGETVLKKLRKLDEVAYVRFASVYRQFNDINTFLKELRKLKRRNRQKGNVHKWLSRRS